jgi:hypothetical protein
MWDISYLASMVQRNVPGDGGDGVLAALL